jgi:predicted nucleic acid-binding protein
LIVADTSGLIAFVNRGDAAHREVAACVAAATTPLIISPFVLAELDSLVLSRWGVDHEQAVLRAVRDSCELATFGSDDLADASIVVLAMRFRTNRLLTLDRRHFRVIRSLDGKPFVLLPDGA